LWYLRISLALGSHVKLSSQLPSLLEQQRTWAGCRASASNQFVSDIKALQGNTALLTGKLQFGAGKHLNPSFRRIFLLSCPLSQTHRKATPFKLFSWGRGG